MLHHILAILPEAAARDAVVTKRVTSVAVTTRDPSRSSFLLAANDYASSAATAARQLASSLAPSSALSRLRSIVVNDSLKSFGALSSDLDRITPHSQHAPMGDKSRRRSQDDANRVKDALDYVGGYKAATSILSGLVKFANSTLGSSKTFIGRDVLQAMLRALNLTHIQLRVRECAEVNMFHSNDARTQLLFSNT